MEHVSKENTQLQAKRMCYFQCLLIRRGEQTGVLPQQLVPFIFHSAKNTRNLDVDFIYIVFVIESFQGREEKNGRE